MPTCSGKAFRDYEFDSQGRCGSVPQTCPTSYSYFYNDEQVYEATCAEGSTGNPVTVTVPANTVASLISKADANALALAQAVSEATMALTCLWYNTEQTGTAECSAPQEGSTSSYVVPAGEFSSTVSQADADEQALDYAIRQATCTLNCVWRNQAQTYTAQCPGQIIDGVVVPIGAAIGDSVTVTIAANTYQSTISQDDANLQAMNAAIAEATPQLVCHWVNTPQSAVNTCGGVIVADSYVNPPGFPVGPDLTFTVPFNTYQSTISQDDADAQALADATEQANDPGLSIRCMYLNVRLEETFTCADNAPCPFGDPVTVIVPFATFSSNLGQDSVDNDAFIYAQAVGLPQLECVCGNEEVTVTAYCPDGFTGPSYTVTIPANTYFADNQADADNVAAENALGIAEYNVGPCITDTDTGGFGGDMEI